MTTSTTNRDLYFGRKFPGGVRFRTLCAGRNSGLGGREDKAIIDFYERVRKLLESRIILSPLMRVPAKPNLIYRGLLAHLVSANDNGIPSSFDVEARNLFFERVSLNFSSWSLFYWIYLSPQLFLMRHAYYTVWYPRVQVIPVHVIKLYPLAFMFTQAPLFLGLSNMRSFLRARHDEEVEVRILLAATDDHPLWPVTAGERNMIILGGNSFGLFGERG